MCALGGRITPSNSGQSKIDNTSASAAAAPCSPPQVSLEQYLIKSNEEENSENEKNEADEKDVNSQAQNDEKNTQSPVKREGPRGLVPKRHNANVSIRNKNGQKLVHKRFVSGNMTPEEKALGHPKAMLATHTEARALKELELQPGDTMTIVGHYEPCKPCKGVMNKAVRNTGAKIVYKWREEGKTQIWVSEP